MHFQKILQSKITKEYTNEAIDFHQFLVEALRNKFVFSKILQLKSCKNILENTV